MELRLKAGARSYRGTDGEKVITVNPGDVIEVSDAKGAQLLRDFPQNWEAVGKGETKAPKNETPAAPAETKEAPAETPAPEPKKPAAKPKSKKAKK